MGEAKLTHDDTQIQKFLPSFASSVPLALSRAERKTQALFCFTDFQLIGPPFIIMT